MKRFIAVILVIFMILATVPTVFAADDTTPPTLDGVTLNAYAFNRKDTLTVTAHSTELESRFDLDNCYAEFVCLDPDDPGMSIDGFGLKLDTLCNEGVQGSIVLDNRLGGTYELSGLRLTDKRGNTKMYAACYNDLPDVTFTLTSNYVKPTPEPDQKPTVTGITMNETKAQVGDTVTYTLIASDSSGIDSASIEIENPEPVADWIYGRYKVPMFPVAGEEGTFTGSIKITKDIPAAKYYPIFYITSNAGKTADYSWSDIYTQLRIETTFDVINPSNPAITKNPNLISYSMSTHQILPGGTFTLTVAIDPKFAKYTTTATFVALLYPLDDQSHIHNDSTLFHLTNQGGGVFSGECKVPYDFSPDVYKLCCFDLIKPSDDLINVGGVVCPPSDYVYEENGDSYLKDGLLTVLSPLTISGTDNRTLMQGDAFDPMAGVTANNAYTGDITDKITMAGGDIDTNVPGVYLIKYKVSGSVNGDGTDYTYNYTDYRWIGVTEIQPEEAAQSGKVPLAVTSGNMDIGIPEGKVSIKKDGVSIPFTNTVTSPGEYTLLCGGSDASISSASGAHIMNIYDGKDTTVSAVIDRSGPDISASWGKDKATGLINVSLKAKDVSSVTGIKYM